MIYKATLGTASYLVTIFTSLLLGSFLVFFLYRAIATPSTVELVVVIVAMGGISVGYLLAYLYRPLHYVLDENNLTIKRRVSDVTIPIPSIRDAFIVKKESMRWTERIGGNGGLFGFYGNFKNDFGIMTWYATKLRNYIIIETLNRGKIIITPDNTDLVKEIRALIGKQQEPGDDFLLKRPASMFPVK